MVFTNPQQLLSTIELKADDVDARARENVFRRYVDGTSRWRRPRMVITTVVILLTYGALPTVPGSESWLRVSLSVFLGAMAIQSILLVASAVAWKVFPPEHIGYQAVSWFDTGFWCASAVVLIAADGRAASIFWLNLASFVVLMATNPLKHTLYACFIAISVAGLVLYFAAVGTWGDALLALILGCMLLLIQRLSTLTAWRAERSQARVELTAEEAGRRLVTEERARISRDLHDSVAAELSAALWAVQAIKVPDTRGLNNVLHRLRVAAAELQEVMDSAGARPISAAEFGARIERIASAMSGERSVRARVTTSEPTRILSSEIATGATRFIQEALHNAQRHSEAGEIVVELEVGEDLRIEVRDDGRGFDVTQISPGRGLENLRERANNFGGEFELHSTPGAGTRLRLRCPLENHEGA